MGNNDNRRAKKSFISTREIIRLESVVRKNVHHSVIYNFLSSVVASFLVFVFYLLSIELVISVVLTVTLTVYAYDVKKNDPNFEGIKLNWTLLTFLVITPMSASIVISFRRREVANRLLADLKANLFELHSVHASWDWRLTSATKQPSGRAASSVNWLQHSDAVLTDIFEILELLKSYLTLPNVNRSRHVVLPSGRRDACATTSLAANLLDSIVYHSMNITEACEVLKQEGMATQECIRIREWEIFLANYIESLRMIKVYRTPQALRSYARLFSAVTPSLYVPYFADLGIQVNSLGFAIILGVISSLALTGLFESIILMEDPFEKLAVLDGINVEEEFNQVFCQRFLDLRTLSFPDAPPFVLCDRDERTKFRLNQQ